MAEMLPTKANLIAAKQSLALATTAYELLERKRNILIQELVALIDEAEKLQAQIDDVFSRAYAALQTANISMGQTIHVAEAISIDDSVEIRSRSIMGVEIPTVVHSGNPPQLEYSLTQTNSALDNAVLEFNRVKELTRELAELENTIYRLADAVKKAPKRANALKNVVIPRYKATILSITTALEEKEREEFSRLKAIKKQKS